MYRRDFCRNAIGLLSVGSVFPAIASAGTSTRPRRDTFAECFAALSDEQFVPNVEATPFGKGIPYCALGNGGNEPERTSSLFRLFVSLSVPQAKPVMKMFFRENDSPENIRRNICDHFTALLNDGDTCGQFRVTGWAFPYLTAAEQRYAFRRSILLVQVDADNPTPYSPVMAFTVNGPHRLPLNEPFDRLAKRGVTLVYGELVYCPAGWSQQQVAETNTTQWYFAHNRAVLPNPDDLGGDWIITPDVFALLDRYEPILG